MKTKKDLQSLLKIRQETNKLKELCFNYQEYLGNNPLIINTEEKLEKLREYETKLTNIIIAILDSKRVFAESESQWRDLNEYMNQTIEVPQKLKRYSNKESMPIRDVLRRARNWEEHPDKADQVVCRFMADELDFQILLQLTYKVEILSLNEVNALSQEEKNKMIANSESLHSRIYTLQNEIDKIKDYIFENENVTEKQKKNLQDLLEFVPNEDNVILLDSDKKEKCN